MPTEYARVNIPVPIAKTLDSLAEELSPHLSLKDLVVQACMEYIEKRKRSEPSNNTYIEPSPSRQPQNSSVFGGLSDFSDFLDE